MKVTALAGIGAPVCFVTGWVVGGARARHYSPLHDAISQLARIGAPTRPIMTAGFVGFGLLALPWARALARSLDDRRVLGSVGLAGLATLAVAALPLGGPLGDGAHALAAGLGYLGMATSPLLGARSMTGKAKAASYAVGAVSAVCLAGSLAGGYDGGLQRLGLGVVDAWFVVMAIRSLRAPHELGAARPAAID